MKRIGLAYYVCALIFYVGIFIVLIGTAGWSNAARLVTDMFFQMPALWMSACGALFAAIILTTSMTKAGARHPVAFYGVPLFALVMGALAFRYGATLYLLGIAIIVAGWFLEKRSARKQLPV